MALCPFAIVKLLHPEDVQAPRITPTQHIRHTAVTTAASLYGYFGRADVTTESHFFNAEDGTLEQYVDTERRADAQFDGNLHGVSTETWDDGDPDHTPWTAAQIATDRRLSLWLYDTHRIPLTVCAGPQTPGQGFHSLFREWAKDGHTCPNGLRIKQFYDLIIPGLLGDDDMLDPADRLQLDNTRADVGAGINEIKNVRADLTSLIGEFRAFRDRPAAASGGPGVLSAADVERIAKAVIAEIAS